MLRRGRARRQVLPLLRGRLRRLLVPPDRLEDRLVRGFRSSLVRRSQVGESVRGKEAVDKVVGMELESEREKDRRGIVLEAGIGHAVEEGIDPEEEGSLAGAAGAECGSLEMEGMASEYSADAEDTAAEEGIAGVAAGRHIAVEAGHAGLHRSNLDSTL